MATLKDLFSEVYNCQVVGISEDTTNYFISCVEGNFTIPKGAMIETMMNWVFTEHYHLIVYKETVSSFNVDLTLIGSEYCLSSEVVYSFSGENLLEVILLAAKQVYSLKRAL